MSKLPGPAYRVETARLSLCCFEPTDAPLLHDAILESLAHLQPYMGFVSREPIAIEERLTYLRTQRGHFDLGGDYHFGLFDKTHTRMLGAVALAMTGEAHEREVGYWIRSDSVRQGLATEAVSALIRIAFDIEELAGLDLRMDPENTRSAGLAKKLGFVGPTLDPLSRTTHDGEKRDVHVYSLARIVYVESTLKSTPLTAYDVLDRRLL